MRALSLMMLGHLDQVEDALREALDLSHRLDHKPSLSQTHMFCAETFIILNRIERGRSASEHLRSACREILVGELPYPGQNHAGLGPRAARRSRSRCPAG